MSLFIFLTVVQAIIAAALFALARRGTRREGGRPGSGAAELLSRACVDPTKGGGHL